MRSEIEKRIALLRKEYKQNIPAKIAELMQLWERLEQQWEPEQFSLFHRKVHNLHGSALTYRFNKLGGAAGRLEESLKPLVGAGIPTMEQKNHILKLIKNLG